MKISSKLEILFESSKEPFHTQKIDNVFRAPFALFHSSATSERKMNLYSLEFHTDSDLWEHFCSPFIHCFTVSDSHFWNQVSARQTYFQL